MKQIKYIVLTAVLFLVSSCLKEPVDNENGSRNNGQIKTDFAVKVAGQKVPAVRSMSEQAENSIKRVDVLAFEVGTDMSEKFAYHVKPNSIVDDNTGEKYINVTLPNGGDKLYRFVLLANLSDAMGDAVAATAVGTLKESVLSALEITNTSKWNVGSTANPDGYTPIPMWGESIPMFVGTDLSGKSIAGIKLSHMVARMDVAVAELAQADFELETVLVYNYNTVGRVAPAADAWNSETVTATKPSLPGSPGTASTPAQYDVESASDHGVFRNIYLFEALAGSKTDLAKAPCIVVGGKFRGAPTSYYRIDILRDDRTTFMDILRNHVYKINVTQVDATGYNTAAEAFAAQSVNLKAELTVWNYNEITEVDFNDQYAFGVSAEEFTFSMDEQGTEDRLNKFAIITDYPEGWRLDSVTYRSGDATGWLNLNTTSGVVADKKVVSIMLTDNTDTSKPERVGYLHLSAGRLQKTITVTQLNSAAISLDFIDVHGNSISEILFKDYVGLQTIEPQSFTVVRTPFKAGSSCSFMSFKVASIPAFTYGSGAIPTSGLLPNGVKEFTYNDITPTPFTDAELANNDEGNPFLEKSTKYEYTLTNGTETLTKSILLRHVSYAAVPVTSYGYGLDGNEHIFSIRSNSSWKVTLKSDPKNVIASYTEATGGYNVLDGVEVKFRLIDDFATKVIGEADVEFEITCTNPDRYFPPQTFSIKCVSGDAQAESNSYVVQPGSETIMIPVSRANATALLGEQITTTDVITAELMWTDNPKGIADDSNIKSVGVFGTGSDGFVTVTPGSGTGNAVVAVKVGGVIKWSWHIWVTSYVPTGVGQSGMWMDRNLGAMNATAGDPGASGLFYQWGRKDPFPGISSNSVAEGTPAEVGQKIYGSTGTELTYGTIANTANGTGINFMQNVSAENFGNSVKNPMYFYTMYTTAPNDWYANIQANKNDNLWNNAGEKTIYDPCPEGWRVPARVSNLDYLKSPAHWGSNTLNISGSPGTPGDTKPQWDATNKGINWSNKGGFYPATGAYSITTTSINISQIGTNGYYASGSFISSASALFYRFSFTQTSMIPSNMGQRQASYSIRCVKE